MVPTIQPHGATLVLDTQSLSVLAASDSTLALLGNPAATLLGKLAGELFDDNSARDIRDIMAHKPAHPDTYVILTWRESAKSFYGRLHIKNSLLILDLEPYPEDCGQPMALCTGLGEMVCAKDTLVLADILQNAVRVLHKSTGFERVLLHHFDESGNGKMLAQARSPQVEPYLGLRPDYDMYKCVRARFKVLRVQHIPKVDYQPSPMLCTPILVPLDLSDSCLRSAPNKQLTSLRTMGVAATLTGSLIVHGKLWGLIECQHLSASKYSCGIARLIFSRICSEASRQITTCLARHARQAARARRETLEFLINSVENGSLNSTAENNCAELLLGAMRADGFALMTRQRFFPIGLVPSETDLRNLLTQLNAEGLSAIASLEQTLGLDGQRVTTNLLIANIGDREGSKLLWFRQSASSDVPWNNREKRFAKSLRGATQLSCERRLRTEMQLMQRITMNSNVAILITEGELISRPGPRILMANRAFEHDTGYSAAEVLGLSPRILQGPQTNPATLHLIRSKLERWEAVQAEVLNYRKDGSTFWVQLNISPITDAYGWVTHWISIQTDVSKQHYFQRDLEQQNIALGASLKETSALAQAKSILLGHIGHEMQEPLEIILRHTEVAQKVSEVPLRVSDALGIVHMRVLQIINSLETLALRADNRALALNVRAEAAQVELARISKAQFFAAASHDLLQPLNAARIYASALCEQSGISLPVRDLAERIDQALVAAEDMIDTLVDVTKLDCHAMAVNIETFPLYPLLSGLAEQLSSMSISRKLKLRVRPCHWLVRSDRRLLRRVLQNLIVNALRYTAKGGVLISTRMRDAKLSIEVWDTGIGIAATHHASIFEDFSRVNSFSPWGDSGNGLGLAICARICGLLNHPLSLESKLGRGSVFRVGVEIGLAGQIPYKDEQILSIDALAPLKVLCIDNDREILRSLVVLLQGWGLQVLTADDSASAQAAVTTYMPDVLVVDQHLGNNELGTELINNLIMPLGNTLIGCVLITADRSDQLRNLCLHNGFHFLYKPLKTIRLRSLMTHFSELASKQA